LLLYDNFTILIVDDDKVNLNVLSRMLESEYVNFDGAVHLHSKILTARSGMEALQTVEKEIPDLILLDIVMPGADGFEVLLKLKKSESTRMIPVIVITGMDNVKYEEKAFYLGAVDYITKPFHEPLVKARVMTHMKIIQQMRMIEQLGLIDKLTGLPNRRYFDSRMTAQWHQAIRNNETVSFCMLDLDHFKNFNDTYGHQHGDVLLKIIAGVIQSSVKRPTDFIARWGGEEFAVILPGTDINNAVNIAESIRLKVENLEMRDAGTGTKIKVTLSAGVSEAVPTAESSMAEFIERADRALYSAKNSGRNKVCS
jgi:diguanylate cyclase (GGDEF)-like protein